MTDRPEVDRLVIGYLEQVSGIVVADRLSSSHFDRVREVESEAEKRSILGMGRLKNSGLREVLAKDRIYVALTNMEFDWGCNSSLVLKKNDEVVGEEVHKDDLIQTLRQEPNVWFMHDSFVIYKDRISFPKDLADNSCYFEIPYLPADWIDLDKIDASIRSPIYANPSPPCDLFLKEKYFHGRDQQDLGTILVGIGLELV